MVQMVVAEKPHAKTKTVETKRKRRRKPRLTGISKQRQSANARERNRMRSIGAAMLQLRHCLPPSLVPKCKKLSKIQTLRLAIHYIACLFEVLRQHEGSDNDHWSDASNFSEEGHLINAEGDEQETSNACPNYESKTDEWMCLSSEYSSDASG